MDRNHALRQRVRRLLGYGITQKALAGRMNLTESTFSRWLNEETKDPLGIDALDAFARFVAELQALLNDLATEWREGMPQQNIAAERFRPASQTRRKGKRRAG